LLLATLSAGPVGIGDPIGSISSSNLLKAVRPDGVIVKPDSPLAPIDASYTNSARGTDTPQIASTYSDFGGLRTYYVFAYTQGSNTEVKFRPSDAGASQPVYVYDYFSGNGQPMDAADLIDRQISGDALYLVMAPIGPSGMAVLGDTDQFITMGKKRVTAIEDDGKIAVTISFAAGETSRTITGFSPWHPAAHALEGAVAKLTYDATAQQFRITVTPGADGTASIHILQSSAKTSGHHTTTSAAQ
jgi:hypothetical protein